MADITGYNGYKWDYINVYKWGYVSTYKWYFGPSLATCSEVARGARDRSGLKLGSANAPKMDLLQIPAPWLEIYPLVNIQKAMENHYCNS